MGTFDHPDRANAYRAVFWSSVGVGTVGLIWGIVDAVTVYKLHHEEQSSFHLAPIENGVQISLVF